MSYKKIGWKNYPSTETPISATNLEHMDDGIMKNDQAIGDMEKVKELGDGTLAGAVSVLNEGSIQPSVKNLDGNFTQKAIVRTYGCKNGNNNTYQIMGRTIIPFNWNSSYAIVLNCKTGSFIYAINVTKNTTHYLSDVDSNGGLRGLNASANDVIVFFGMVEFI